MISDELTSEPDCTAPAARPSRVYGWVGLALAVVGFALVCWAYAMTTRWMAEEGIRPVTVEEGSRPSVVRLRAVLGSFLSASSVDDRARCVLRGAELRSRMAAYYAGRDRDEIDFASFEPLVPKRLNLGPDVMVLQSARLGARPVVAAFARENGTWKLDWELFTQTYDDSFRRSLARPDFGVGTYQVILHRVHGGAGESDLSVAVVDPFDSGQRVAVSLPEGSLLRGRVLRGLSTEPQALATVEMSWAQPDAGSSKWVPQLQRIVCWGWRGLNEQADERMAAVTRREEAAEPSSLTGVGTEPPVRSESPAQEPTPALAPPGAATAVVSDR